MGGVARISVSLEKALLQRFDRLVADEGYPTRSEAVKALVREALVQKEWTKGREVAGAITLVYDHHKRSLVNKMLDVQHEFGEVVVATQHVHLDHHNCLEVVAVRGRVRRIRELVSALKSVKGLKHCALVMTTAAGDTG